MTSIVKVDKIVPATGTTTTLGESGDTIQLGDGATAVGFSNTKNLIINGGFDIWQRGTSFTSTNVNEFSSDRWRTEGNTYTSVISRQDFATGQTDVPNYPTHYCRIAVSSTVSSGQYWAFQQRVETPQFISGYGTYTLSFWVKSPTGTISAGAFSYGIKSSAGASSPEITTSWQKVTHSMTTNGPNNVDYLSVYVINLGQGQGNITLDIANVQLEFGENATDFGHRSYGEELDLCHRYFFTSEDSDYFIDGFGVSNGEVYYRTILHPQAMRDNPTITIYNESASLMGPILVIRNYKTRWTYRLAGTAGANGSTAGNVQFDYTADAEL